MAEQLLGSRVSVAVVRATDDHGDPAPRRGNGRLDLAAVAGNDDSGAGLGLAAGCCLLVLVSPENTDFSRNKGIYDRS